MNVIYYELKLKVLLFLLNKKKSSLDCFFQLKFDPCFDEIGPITDIFRKTTELHGVHFVENICGRPIFNYQKGRKILDYELKLSITHIERYYQNRVVNWKF